MGPKFEWDAAKAESNLRKHGIRFETATKVFEDGARTDAYQGDEDGEPRWLAVGAVGERVITVVYTWQGDEEDETVRIISARRATRSESRRYESGA